MQGSQRCARAFSESREGMRREGPRFASFEYPIQTAAGQVYICVGLLSYGQNLAYPIVRGQMCQISRMQADVVRSRSKLSVSRKYHPAAGIAVGWLCPAFVHELASGVIGITTPSRISLRFQPCRKSCCRALAQHPSSRLQTRRPEVTSTLLRTAVLRCWTAMVRYVYE